MTPRRTDVIAALRGTLVVSCQARPPSPLADPAAMAAMARAAVAGGAQGIRACGADDIAAIREVVNVPIIGLTKRAVADSPVYITPLLEDARAVVTSGADLVAIDATLRTRPGSVPTAALIASIVALGAGVVADVDDVEAGVRAAEAGALLVSTTLAGYTGGPVPTKPNIDLVRDLATALGPMVIAEGRYREPSEIERAFEAGAIAVVVGKAITDPVDLTRRLVRATPGSRGER